MDPVTAQLAAQLIPQRHYGVKVAGLGDSETARGFSTASKGWTSLADGSVGELLEYCWHQWASMLSGGAFRFTGAAAHGGWTTQQIVEGNSGETDFKGSLLNLVLASDADVVVVLSGTNDVGNGVSIATTKTYYDRIVKQLIARGKLPVICSLPPRESSGVAETGTLRTQLIELNAWYSKYARETGVPFCDLHAVLAQKSSVWKTGYNFDNFHMAGKGAREAGRALADTLVGWLTPAPPYLGVTAEGTGTTLYSRVGNPLMDDLDADSVVDGWAATTGTAMKPIQDPNIIGAWLRARRAGGTDTLMLAGNTIPASAGDKILVSCRIRAGVEYSAGQYDFRLFSSPSTNVRAFGLSNWSTDIPDGAVLNYVFTCPDLAGETALKLETRGKLADGAWLDIAQLTVQNLTTTGTA